MSKKTRKKSSKTASKASAGKTASGKAVRAKSTASAKTAATKTRKAAVRASQDRQKTTGESCPKEHRKSIAEGRAETVKAGPFQAARPECRHLAAPGEGNCGKA